MIGIIICSLYFVNSMLVNYGVEKYIKYALNKFSSQQIIDFFVQNDLMSNPNVYYYTLIFIAMFWLYLGLILILSIIYRKQIIKKIKVVRKNPKHFLYQLLKYIGGLLILTAFVYYINITFFSEYQSTIGENQSVINQVVLYNPNIYIFVVVFLFAPLIEEYIFRYGLINKLLKNWKPGLQVVVSALIFSLIHLNIEQFIASPMYFFHLLLLYLPMSIIYGYVYVKEKNILFPLIIHILNNIGSILIVLISSKF